VSLPKGKWIKASIRRNTAPWDLIGNTTQIQGNGTWQSVSTEFRPRYSVDNARLDIEFTGDPDAYIDDVQISPVVAAPKALYLSNIPQTIAHHPNRGHDGVSPTSPYYRTSANSNSVPNSAGTAVGSNYLPIGPELAGLTSTQLLGAKTKVYVRTTPWVIEDFLPTSVQSGKLFFDRVSRYPILKDFGYFLTGALWMLDEPGEWVSSEDGSKVYVSPSDESPPLSRASIVELATGIDVSGRSNIHVRNVSIRHTETGFNISNSHGIQISDCRIDETSGEGITASGAQSAVISRNLISNTGLDSITAFQTGSIAASGMIISDNKIQGSGVRIEDGKLTSLPVASYASIYSGQNSIVTGNEIRNAIYNGIYPGKNSTVSFNTINNACVLLDDCGGIYLYGENHNTTISKNVIQTLIGTIDGIPRIRPHTVGIYLDIHSSMVNVLDNTITNANYGIHLHSAANNQIRGNTLYGNRTYQLWLQEGSRQRDPLGDISGNVVTENSIFSTAQSIGISHDTIYASTGRFANYDRNTHSGLINRYVAREGYGTAETALTFPAWQSAKINGTPRNLDINGKEVREVGYTSFMISGSNMISALDPADNGRGWGMWSQARPLPVLQLTTCGTEPCLQMQAGASPSMITSPHFSVSSGQWYRVSFDMRATRDNVRLEIAPRRGGGGTNGYEFLDGTSTRIFAMSTWKRYSIFFKSAITINADDPITLDKGARIDLQNIASGETVFLSNMEVVTAESVGTTLETALLVNEGNVDEALDCPSTVSDPNACAHFVTFRDDTPISWPHVVPAYGSEIIYTKDKTLLDTDGDGIADTQDACPGTPTGHQTNSDGCPRP
jgi:parallel beta-helix repeat protein